MSKRPHLDTSFKPPQPKWQDTTEDAILKHMEHVTAQIEELKDSIEHLVCILLKEQQEDSSESTNSDKL